MTDQPTTAIVSQRAKLFKRLKNYPDYIDDADGLERLRQDVKSSSGHDMAALNYNSLGRLIDTIERLRYDRAEIEAATIERCAGVDVRSGLLHDVIHKEARERCINDATQSGYEHHLVIVAAEHGAKTAIRNLKGQTS